ncbi:hypothetical protein TWF718_009611 [Orbilia javanica]|uniref:Peptidase S8/S53 domain-containing protein n=1 Tax=Orbilia javanica TaxID=47235 RepID=A0AAN8RBL2_9PEZI
MLNKYLQTLNTTKLLAFFLLLFLPNQCASKQIPSHQKGHQQIGVNVRLWWFVLARNSWKDRQLVTNLKSVLLPCGKDADPESIHYYESPYIGVPFITLKTDVELSCDVEKMQTIFKLYESKLAGWGEVPYAAPPRRIVEHEDVIYAKPGVNNPTPTDPTPNGESQDTREKPDKEGNTIHQNNTGPKPSNRRNGGIIDLSDLYEIFANKTESNNPSSGLPRRDTPNCAGVKRRIQVRLDHFEERRRICEPATKNLDIERVMGNFCYQATTDKCSRGHLSNVYIIDTALDLELLKSFARGKPLNHLVGSDFQFNIENYFTTGPDPVEDKTDIPPAAYHHGTAVYSLIGTDRLGHAVKAKINFVQYYNRYGYYTTAHLFNAMLVVLDDIVVEKRRHAIISCSWFYDQVDPNNPLFQDVYEPPIQSMSTNALVRWLSSQLTQLFASIRGVVIVTPTGHPGLQANPGSYLPPTSDAEKYPGVIVPVGATNRWDEKMFDDDPGSPKVQIKIWAPGEGVHIAARDEADNLAVLPATGVGYAVATVVGILAAYISEGIDPSIVVEALYRLAFPRYDGGPHIVSNGVTLDEWPEGLDRSYFKDRVD